MKADLILRSEIDPSIFIAYMSCMADQNKKKRVDEVQK